ncbi:P-loop containing nucleoside triphosphate hydrolase protein [Dioscorea alata]|uniref:P-loop containing nucleoside triphosphate hydrolase protein n=1 Tax=Dioscorea alata TaxID=55571 RepID=A0ACB7WU47_DIOAL|nr:P-loop containing nucleoside triphosphate hydrolase protein [Dioscorea alata]
MKPQFFFNGLTGFKLSKLLLRNPRILPNLSRSSSFTVSSSAALIQDLPSTFEAKASPLQSPQFGEFLLNLKPGVALSIFNNSLALGLRRDLASYVAIVCILFASDHRHKLVSLFADLVSSKPGVDFSFPDLFDTLSRFLNRSGKLLFVLDALIRAFTVCNKPREAFDAVVQLAGRGFVPSPKSCNFLLNFMVESSDFELVMAVFEQMKSFGMSPDAYRFTILIKALCRGGKFDAAFIVLEEMKETGVMPDVITYTTLIEGLCASGKSETGSALLQTIIQKGVPVDSVLYGKVISGLCKELRLQEAEKLLQDMVKRDVPADAFSYGCLIRGYCTTGNAADLLRALELYDEMVSKYISPNYFVVSFILQCFSKRGMDSEALGYFQMFKVSGGYLDKVLYNFALNAHCKLGNMDDAIELIEEMKGHGIVPDKIHYTILICGYCRNGEMYNAQKVFSSMVKLNVEPDLVTYNVLVGGFCKHGFVKEAYELMDYMIERGLEPNAVTYSVAIENLCKGRHLKEAKELFKGLKRRGLLKK